MTQTATNTKTKTKKAYKLHELITDMSSAEYHGTEGTYSSSQLKDLVDDEGLFIKKYILNEIPREEVAAFDVGTYFHTGVLEPHKLKMECVVFPGKVRRGKEWDSFKEKNKDKVIVSSSQKDQAEGLVKSVLECKMAKEFITGTPEVSLFTDVAVHDGEIFAPYFNRKLTIDGWVTQILTEKPEVVFVIKVRSDTLGDTFISDLKSTTGNARSNISMRKKISDYTYDLSASLYLDMFSLMRPTLREFVWIFASKDYYNCRVYKATENNIKVGRAKYMKALIKLADCKKNNWEVIDFVDTLEPLPYELEHLIIKDKDLL